MKNANFFKKKHTLGPNDARHVIWALIDIHLACVGFCWPLLAFVWPLLARGGQNAWFG
jgi:hypothetical protein